MTQGRGRYMGRCPATALAAHLLATTGRPCCRMGHLHHLLVQRCREGDKVTLPGMALQQMGQGKGPRGEGTGPRAARLGEKLLPVLAPATHLSVLRWPPCPARNKHLVTCGDSGDRDPASSPASGPYLLCGLERAFGFFIRNTRIMPLIDH